MVRNRKRKTDYGLHSEKDMAEAILMVESGVSLRKAANEKHVNFMTLQRYVQKKKKCSEHEDTYDLHQTMQIEWCSASNKKRR